MFRHQIFTRFLTSLFTCALMLGSVPVYAAGGFSPYPLDFSASSTSAVTGNKITFTTFVYLYECAGGIKRDDPSCPEGTSTTKAGEPNQKIALQVSGSGNTLGGVATTDSGIPYVISGADGRAQFTLASSAAEAKTLKAVHFSSNPNFENSFAASTSVTFTSPPPATPKKTTTPTSTPAPTPAPVAAPEAPKTTALTIDGQQVADTQNIVVENNQPLSLSGTTVPNGVVKLYIFSTPREASVTADANGNWAYVVEGLEAGEHHVEAEVTDPATNKTSARATLAAFTVKAPKVVAQTTAKAAPKRSNALVWIGLAVAVVVLAGAGAWWFWWRKKHTVPRPLSDPDTRHFVNPDNSAGSVQSDDPADQDDQGGKPQT